MNEIMNGWYNNYFISFVSILDHYLVISHYHLVYSTSFCDKIPYLTFLDLDSHVKPRNAFNFDIRDNPANTKYLYNIRTTPAQRFRRWSSIVQMLYKCFVFAGNRV